MYDLFYSGLRFTIVFLLLTLATISANVSAQDINQLISDLDSASQGDVEYALYELAKLGSDASLAIETICGQLDSTSFSVRSLASEALFEIGSESISPLRKMLKHESPPVRATVIQTLGRLNSISLEELNQFAQTDDSRINSAIAIALRHSHFEDSDTELAKTLVKLLEHDDHMVIVQTCLCIQTLRVAPNTITPALVKVMQRTGLKMPICETLSRYGTDANSTIPFLIQQFDEQDIEMGSFGYLRKDPKVTVTRMGPPAQKDIEFLFSLIDEKKPERSTWIVETVGRLEKLGSQYADRLNQLATQLIDKATLQKQKYDAAPPDDREEYNNYYELFWLAKSCAVAEWNVSHNAKRFVSLIEKIEIHFEGGIYFRDEEVNENPWIQFTASDSKEIAGWLTSNNDILRETALSAIEDIGPNAHPLSSSLIDLLKQQKFKTKAIDSLASIGQPAVADVLPQLVTLVKQKNLETKDLANYVSNSGLTSNECNELLILGLSKTKSANECMEALCRTTQSEKVFNLVVQAAENNRVSKDNATRELSAFEIVPPSALEFASANLMREQYDAPNPGAIKILSKIGPAAKNLEGEIRKHENYRSFDMRLNCAVSLFRIVDDHQGLNRTIVEEIKNPDNRFWERLKLIEEIVALGEKGTSFHHHIWENEQYFVDECVEEYCDILGSMKAPRAIKSLEKISKSKDWAGQKAATHVLQKLKKKSEEDSK